MFLSGGSPREGARSELASGAATGGGGPQAPPTRTSQRHASLLSLAADEAPEGVDLVGAEGYGYERVEGGAGADAGGQEDCLAGGAKASKKRVELAGQPG